MLASEKLGLKNLQARVSSR